MIHRGFESQFGTERNIESFLLSRTSLWLYNCRNVKKHNRSKVKIVADTTELIITDRTFLSFFVTVFVIIGINHPRPCRFGNLGEADETLCL